MGTRLCTCSNSNDDHILLDPETSNEDWIPKGELKKNDQIESLSLPEKIRDNEMYSK